jgi:hypothetical protein
MTDATVMSEFRIRPLRLDEMSVPLGWAEREGWQVWCAGLAHLDAVACVGLDGVLAQQNNYAKSGFTLVHKNSRFEGKPQQSATPLNLAAGETLHSIENVPFDALMTFDSLHFPTRRPEFLRAWISQAGHRGQVIVQEGRIRAFGVVRPCVSGYKIGPLFAQTPLQARNLILALCDCIEPNASVYIDPPAQNLQAFDLLESLGMTMVFETARMYKGGSPELPLSEIFGITSFELG